jgi:hypothetical protein
MLAARHVEGFLAAGAETARIVAGPPDGQSFGARLRGLVVDRPKSRGIVVLGSGSLPLATARDRAAFVLAAGSPQPRALANNRYSADIIAIARAPSVLRDLPDLETDNALPRWLAENAGVPVDDLARRWRLGIDIDGPLDLVLVGGRLGSVLEKSLFARVDERLAAVSAVAADPHAELVIAGRTSATALLWVERATAARTRAIVEERGLRTRQAGQRPARSVLGELLDRDGPGTLGARLAELGDAALIDTRVLLAHRFGDDETRWPRAEDRFASDLLLPDSIHDPWLRQLTDSAVEAPIPIVLGGHTLVGPGLRLALRGRHGGG